MKIGYMRVSTEDQDMTLQKAALERYGCDRIFSDQISGRITSREGLNAALAALKSGDTFVVWKLDRFARNTAQAMTAIDDFLKRKIGFVSITEGFDTTTPTGKAMAGMIAIFAELERSFISERTKAGLAAVKARGDRIGRLPAPPEAIALAKELRRKNMTLEAISRELANRGHYVLRKDGPTTIPYKPASVRHMILGPRYREMYL